MGGNNDNWDGETERRAADSARRESDAYRNTPLDNMIWRFESNEKKIDKIEEKVDSLTIGFTTLKVEMLNLAKDEGKLSGSIYGIGGAIVTAVILKVLENGLGG